MPIPLFHESGNVYRIEIRGTLSKADLDRCQAEVAAQMDRIGPIRLLVILDRFEGWTSGDRWNDLSFYVTRGDALERIAIVGDERWRDEALMFAVADLRRGPVEFFPTQSIDAARTWLSAV